MEDYIILTWPEVQEYMDYEDFEAHSTLVYPNPLMGIESCTYLIDKGWYTHLQEMNVRVEDINYNIND